MLYIAADHGGYDLKKSLLKLFAAQDIDVEDMGTYEYDVTDDYPDFVIPVMRKMQQDPHNKAILICKNGVGVSVLANKFRGIRCSLSWNSRHAESSRNDDNSNVLALPADYIDEKTAEETSLAWFKKTFSDEERHKRRLQKIENVNE